MGFALREAERSSEALGDGRLTWVLRPGGEVEILYRTVRERLASQCMSAPGLETLRDSVDNWASSFEFEHLVCDHKSRLIQELLGGSTFGGVIVIAKGK